MTNNQLIIKLKKDMQMRNFSKYTYDSYLGKTKDIMRYFGVRIDIWTHFMRGCIIDYVH